MRKGSSPKAQRRIICSGIEPEDNDLSITNPTLINSNPTFSITKSYYKIVHFFAGKICSTLAWPHQLVLLIQLSTICIANVFRCPTSVRDTVSFKRYHKQYTGGTVAF